MKLRGLDQLELAGKTVLLRTDYNVPIKDGVVHDDFRIRASLPTIQYLLDKQCRIIIVSHLGRPDGKVVEEFSLRPAAKRLTDLLRKKISFVKTIAAAKGQTDQICMLENLRFDPREEANDPTLAKELAELADVYVDDAFAVVHRAHASTVGVPKLLPSAAGLLVQQEVDALSSVLNKPEEPFLAVIGGAKVSDKIDLIEQLISKANALFVGGAMANTFLASQGIAIGASRYEPEELAEAKRLLAKARKNNVRVILPSDVVVTEKVEAGSESKTINLSDLGPTDIIADIGPKSLKVALDVIKSGGTVLWNGPLGVDEIPEFAKGTLKLARGIIASKAYSVIGGGDTADVLDKAGLHKKFSFVSTGGGAALELLAGKELPGLAALSGETQAKTVQHVASKTVLSSGGQNQKRGPLIVANWKANTTLPKAIKLAEAVNAAAKKYPHTQVVLCPPSIYTTLLRHGLGSLYVDFGVQDISQFEVGTHTGELPASIAAQVANFAIIGHSERRAQHETDKQVSAKVVRALQAGLQPIVCVGDRLIDKQHGHALRHVQDQLEVALRNVTAEELDRLVVAYEPVWAISSGDGHGHVATPTQVEKMVVQIRLMLQSRFGDASSKVRVVYGGSVNGDNSRAYIDIKGVNGLLVGGASLDSHEFGQILSQK
jgi:triosephosphate isomerase (TIM)